MKKRPLSHTETCDSTDGLNPPSSQADPETSTSNDSLEASTATSRLDSAHDSTNDPSLISSYSTSTVYISGMPLKYCTEAVIEKIMAPYGTIIRCSVHNMPQKQYAFCDFAKPQQAMDAIRAVHGRKLGGQSLVVRRAFRDHSANAVGFPTAIPAGNPKRQKQQLDANIEAIKLKLAKQTHQAASL